ncbi:hypothetical protein GCQ56_05320 [Marinifilum sp. N1E240]|uniref:hypothetical protein n=1 Tax=Marinifilum sp. N1E240 TaxID=2608082 RepID=UPI00128D6288|nr:hypothetical protein [Marinifilum sp. N1E240]MPQ46424.1 hypothetical protein [Marinifilum sp. N1E240]
MENSTKTPNLFLYSLILPILWISIGFLIDTIAPEKSLGVFGLVLIIYATLTPICWHFTKNHHRHFKKQEKIKLIVFLTFWAVLCELLAIWYELSLESNPDISSSIYYIIGVTILLDTLFITIGVQVVAKRTNNYFLEKIDKNR